MSVTTYVSFPYDIKACNTYSSLLSVLLSAILAEMEKRRSERAIHRLTTSLSCRVEAPVRCEPRNLSGNGRGVATGFGASRSAWGAEQTECGRPTVNHTGILARISHAVSHRNKLGTARNHGKTDS